MNQSASPSHDSETPAPGQQVITVCAFIHRLDQGVLKVFLAKRAATKKFLPGMYELPGGHIDFGEGLVDGLRREIKEELSMDIKVGDPFAAFTYANAVKGSHSVEVVYFATFRSPLQQLMLDPGDHSEFRWMTEAESAALKQEDDGEYDVRKKAFQLLNNASMNFGY